MKSHSRMKTCLFIFVIFMWSVVIPCVVADITPPSSPTKDLDKLKPTPGGIPDMINVLDAAETNQPQRPTINMSPIIQVPEDEKKDSANEEKLLFPNLSGAPTDSQGMTSMHNGLSVFGEEDEFKFGEKDESNFIEEDEFKFEEEEENESKFATPATSSSIAEIQDSVKSSVLQRIRSISASASAGKTENTRLEAPSDFDATDLEVANYTKKAEEDTASAVSELTESSTERPPTNSCFSQTSHDKFEPVAPVCGLGVIKEEKTTSPAALSVDSACQTDSIESLKKPKPSKGRKIPLRQKLKVRRKKASTPSKSPASAEAEIQTEPPTEPGNKSKTTEPGKKPNLSIDTDLNSQDNASRDDSCSSPNSLDSDYQELRPILVLLQSIFLWAASIIFVAIVLYSIYYVRMIKAIYDQKERTVD